MDGPSFGRDLRNAMFVMGFLIFVVALIIGMIFGLLIGVV